MHGYAKRGEAENLFASMEILGLLPEEVQGRVAKLVKGTGF